MHPRAAGDLAGVPVIIAHLMAINWWEGVNVPPLAGYASTEIFVILLSPLATRLQGKKFSSLRNSSMSS